MSISAPSSSGIALAITLFLVLFPILFLSTYLSSGTKNDQNPYNLSRLFQFGILAAYGAWQLSMVLWFKEPNVFKSGDSGRGISLVTPSYALQHFLKNSKIENIDQLIPKLSSLQTRIYYVRFGHNVVSNCDWCTPDGWDEWALVWLVGLSWEYVKAVFIVGAITTGFGGLFRKWRTWLTLGFLGLFCGEIYWTLTVDIEVPSDTTGANPVMWHDILTTIRTVAFAILPIILVLTLPPTPQLHLGSAHIPQTPAEALLHHLVFKLQTLKYTHTSIQTNPNLRAKAARYWQTEREEGEYVRNDAKFRQAYEALSSVPQGVSAWDDLRGRARVIVQRMLNAGNDGGFGVSPLWKWATPSTFQDVPIIVEPHTNDEAE